MKTLVVALALLPAAGWAQDVLSTVTLDLTPGHPGAETATLVQNPQQGSAADLVIRAGDGTELLNVPEMTTAGSFAGAAPRLEVAPNGTSLQIYQEWTGIGRNPWESMTTLAYRGDGIVVAGHTLSMWDRVTNETLSCDWNLLTGGYTVDACALPVADAAEPGDCVTQKTSGTRPARLTPAEWAGDQGAVFASFCKLRDDG